MAKQTQSAKTTTTAKSAAARKAASKGSMIKSVEDVVLDPEDRYNMIAEEAYYLAEKRGFEGDLADADWLQAEAKVDARFSARH